MKKILGLVMLVLFPISSFAGKWKVILDGKDNNVYEDSIVKVEVGISDDFTSVDLCIYNRTDSRLCIEWENVKVKGSKIAFWNERYNENKRLEDGVLMARRVSLKTVRNRDFFDIPLVIEMDGKRIVYLDIPIKLINGYHDLSLKFIVK